MRHEVLGGYKLTVCSCEKHSYAHALAQFVPQIASVSQRHIRGKIEVMSLYNQGHKTRIIEKCLRVEKNFPDHAHFNHSECSSMCSEPLLPRFLSVLPPSVQPFIFFKLN